MYALLKTVGPEQWHQQHCCGVRGWAELQQSLQHRHHQQQQVKKKKCIIVRQSTRPKWQRKMIKVAQRPS